MSATQIQSQTKSYASAVEPRIEVVNVNDEKTIEPTVENTVRTSRFPPMEPMYYKILSKGSRVVYHEIKDRTENFKLVSNPEYANNLSTVLNGRNLTVYYGFLNQPDSDDINKRVIGKGGFYLHKTTSDQNVLFIWRNSETKQYEFWSLQRQSLIRAMDSIRYRIHKVSNTPVAPSIVEVEQTIEVIDTSDSTSDHTSDSTSDSTSDHTSDSTSDSTSDRISDRISAN